jgi:hypothetical protein
VEEREIIQSTASVAALTAFNERAKEEDACLSLHKQAATDSGTKAEYSIEFGFDLCAKYIERYPLATETFKVMVGGDKKPMLEVGFALHLGNGTVLGKMDGVIDNGDLLENKSTSMYLTDIFLSQYTVHNQVSIYLAALRDLLGRTPKKCVMNLIRVHEYKRKPTEKDAKLFSRVNVQRTDSQLDQTLRQFEFRINQIKNFLRVGFDAFYQSAPDACMHKFGVCEYLPLCMAQEKELVEMIMYGEYKEEEWVPYDIAGAKTIVDVKPSLT